MYERMMKIDICVIVYQFANNVIFNKKMMNEKFESVMLNHIMLEIVLEKHYLHLKM